MTCYLTKSTAVSVCRLPQRAVLVAAGVVFMAAVCVVADVGELTNEAAVTAVLSDR